MLKIIYLRLNILVFRSVLGVMDDGYSEISSDGGEDKLYSQVLNYLFI